MAEKQSCLSCAYSRKGKKMLECRIAPPVHILNQYKESSGVWPVVDASGWCSEWEQKEKPVKQVEEKEQVSAPISTMDKVSPVAPVEEMQYDVGVKPAVNPLTNSVDVDEQKSVSEKEIEDLNKQKLDAQGYVETEAPESEDEVFGDDDEDDDEEETEQTNQAE